jgi:hypothetical protein
LAKGLKEIISNRINNMDINYLETDASYYLTKDYGVGNENLKIEALTEVFTVVYTLKKKGSLEPEEVYSFTTDFEQAFKRFKLLPHTKCLLKRVFTDDDTLIKLAIDGTKLKAEQLGYDKDELDKLASEYDVKEILDRFRDEDDNGKPVYNTGFTAKEADEETVEKLREMGVDDKRVESPEQLSIAPPSSPEQEATMP